MLCGQTIHTNGPLFCPLVFTLLIMGRSKFGNEVYKGLGFFCFPWSKSHVKFTKFHCLLDQSPSSFQLIHSLLQWVIYQDINNISLEIRPDVVDGLLCLSFFPD